MRLWRRRGLREVGSGVFHAPYPPDIRRKHVLPTEDTATLHTIRNVRDVDGGGQVSYNACADDTHCVSTHGKQDSANGNRKRREEGDRSPWCIRLSSFPEDGHHRPESAIRHGARNDGARLRSPRRKAPRTPSRPHGAPRSSVQGSHTHTHAARPCNEPQKTRTIAEYNARAFFVLPSVLHSLPPSLPPDALTHTKVTRLQDRET